MLIPQAKENVMEWEYRTLLTVEKYFLTSLNLLTKENYFPLLGNR